MTSTTCTPEQSFQRRISRRRFLRCTGLAGLALLSGRGAVPLFGGGSNQADADQSHKVYFPFIAKVPPIPPLSPELVQEAYHFYSLGDPVPPSSLRFEFRPNLNNPDQPLIVFACDPETNEIFLATRLNLQTQEQEWHVAKLRDLADAVGIRIGSNLSSPWFDRATIEEHDQIVTDNFNHGILETLSWPAIENNRGVFTFEKTEEAIELAKGEGMTTEAAPLVYSGSDFEHVLWLKEYRELAQRSGFLDLLAQIDLGEFMHMDYQQQERIIEEYINQIEDPEMRQQIIEMRQELRGVITTHVSTIVSRLKGKVDAWRIVNEFDVNPRSFWDPCFFLAGPDYVDLAFQTAREADPQTPLIMNITGNERRDGYFYQITLPVVRRLKEKGLIDTVGFQLHINAANPPDWGELVETMRGYEQPIAVTELDINLKDVEGSDEERYELQATILRELFTHLMNSDVPILYFDMWEAWRDKDSWLERLEVPGQSSPNADPTIFDDNSNPKPAYFALNDALQEMIDQE